MSILRASWPIFLALVLVVLASTLFYSQFSLNHDTSWYLVSTRMFMDGATLYKDIVEINPPLAFYLTVPSLLLADLTHLRPPTAYFLYVSILGGFSALWVYAILLRSGLEKNARRLLFSSAIAGIFLMAIHDFGQREHLLLIFALPYFYYLIFRDKLAAVAKWESVALGLTAFFGLGLKPYFFLIPAGIIVARFCSNRNIREFLNLANVSAGLATVGYVGFIAVVHPLYIEDILPTASLIYSAYGREAVHVLVQLELLALPMVFALALFCRKNMDQAAWAMLGGVAGATISYLIQFKGWNYQIIPASVFVFIAVVWITYIDRATVRKYVLLGILSVAAVILTLGKQVWYGPYPARTSENFGQFVVGAGVPVLVLSSNVSVSFPFVNDVDARWTSRYPAQWLLPGAVSLLNSTDCRQHADLCARYREVLSQARSAMVEDFKRNQPVLVFVDNRIKKSYFGDVEFDYVAFLLQDAAFAEMWKEYRHFDDESLHQVWGRRDYIKHLKK